MKNMKALSLALLMVVSATSSRVFGMEKGSSYAAYGVTFLLGLEGYRTGKTWWAARKDKGPRNFSQLRATVVQLGKNQEKFATKDDLAAQLGQIKVDFVTRADFDGAMRSTAGGSASGAGAAARGARA